MDDDQSNDTVGQNPFVDGDDDNVGGDDSMNPFLEEDGGLLFFNYFVNSFYKRSLTPSVSPL